ncbi:MAG: M10 family metallopeptidase domain-containing protein [archaeon]|jgi:hypothetical protein|nr:M10 family metallopeptidase domain-containing protein [archaeon]
MKILEILLMGMLIIALAFGTVIFIQSLPGESEKYQTYSANLTASGDELAGLTEESAQFYPRMRYPTRVISYRLESTCPPSRWIDTQSAFDILSEKTILQFYYSKDAGEKPDITIHCSEIVPSEAEYQRIKGHFIAGEGGPTEILVNASLYGTMILGGNISLYKEERCDRPQIAIHEILHALGFDHNTNQNSILYPVSSCLQEIDQYIIDEINRIYSIEPNPDLMIDRIEANRTGRYLNFIINISNRGLKDAGEAYLEVYAGQQRAYNYTLGSVEIGEMHKLHVQNVRIPYDSGRIAFVVSAGKNEMEMNEANNRVEVSLAISDDN